MFNLDFQENDKPTKNVFSNFSFNHIVSLIKSNSIGETKKMDCLIKMVTDKLVGL